MMDSNVAAILGMVLIVALVAGLLGWSVWLYFRRRQERIQAELEVRRRMIDKFASADELTAFLASEGGRSFLEDLSTGTANHADRILASVQRGAVLTLLGLGSWLLVAWNPQDLEAAGILGTLAVAVGLGYLVSAGASYRLSKRWGLLPPGNG